MANVRVAWTAEGDARRQFWRVYTSDDRNLKGVLIAEVDPEDRVYVLRNIDEGPLFVRVLSVSMGSVEEDWTSAVVGSRVITRQVISVATYQNATVAKIDPASSVTVVLDPPSSDEPATQVEVTRGSEASLGQLVGTYPVTRADVTGEGGERQYTFPIPASPGAGAGVETLQVRPVVPGGRRPGGSTPFTVPSLPMANYDSTTHASIVTGTLTGIYAPTSLQSWEHGSWGARLREIPPSSEWLGGWGDTDDGLLANTYSGAYYLTLATISTATIDLGTDREFVLDLWDEARRSSTELALLNVASKDLSAPSNPVEARDSLGLDGGTINPDWIFHEYRSDGKPLRPMPPTRWRYRTALASEVGTWGTWRHYIPGTRLRARYLMARMEIRAPMGFSQVVVPRAYVRTWLAHGDSAHSEVITSPAGGAPDPNDILDLTAVDTGTAIDGEVIVVRAERGNSVIGINLGGVLQYVALTS